MYFDTASFALSSVVCAISRIFSVCSLILSLIALSCVGPLGRCSLTFRASLRRLLDLLQLFAKLVDQHAGVLAVIDGDGNEMHPAVLKRPLERWDQIVGAFDLRTLRAVTLGIFHEVRVSKRQAEIGEMIHRLLPPDHAVG